MTKEDIYLTEDDEAIDINGWFTNGLEDLPSLIY